MNPQVYMDAFVELLKEELSDNLIGVYLHGSLAMNCFNPESSDMDFIVMIKNELKKEQSRRIARRVLALHDEMPYKKGIEFSMILQKYVKPFRYPTPFEFHYSDFHRERYRADEGYVCGGFEDEDLASQFMVAYHRGTTLYGIPLPEICAPIDIQYYIASIYYDVKDSAQDILHNPVYVVLNLCRVLYYLKEEVVSSKKEGGEWGLKALPEEFKDMIRRCLDKYTGAANELELGHEQLLYFAEVMMEEINRLIAVRSHHLKMNNT